MSDPLDSDNEEEAIRALLASDGWRLFSAYIESEWGAAAYAGKIDKTIAAGRSQDRSIEADVCELGAAARAVKLAVHWPAQRLAAMTKKAPAIGRPAFLRRGQQ